MAANVLGALTCLLGTSNTVPPADAGWSLDARPGTPLIIVLTFTTVGLGALGVCVALQALRRGWRPSPRLLLGLGLGFAALFALVPIGGSNDVQSYAVYGRMGVLGLDPYTTVPRELVAAHDQVARFGPDTWLDTPSVYGPVANWLFTFAAHLGGASMFRITLILKVVAAAAFALVALVLDRLAGPSPDRRARAHLLWTLNPLLLWACVAGAHVDVIAAAFMILAFAAVTRSGLPAPLVAGLSAGALIGVAASVKAPFALAGLGLAWAARGSWQTLAGLAAGVTAVVAAAYALAGQSAVDVLLNKAEDVAPTNPWRWLPRWGLDLTHPQMAQAGFAAAAVIALIMLWRLPATTLLPTGPDRPELAACVAFAACAGLLMASPQQHPWYDAMIFPLLALLPFTRIDELVQLRLLAGSLGYLPGVPLLTGVRWPEPMHWVRNEFNNWWMSAALGLLMIAIVLVLLFRRPAPARAGASPHTTG
ncbi:MAG: polyprenol phosphomannose-dependent alpha 1,6 mannosyltransferase MptB [Streptosporangiaceae bacterium]